MSDLPFRPIRSTLAMEQPPFVVVWVSSVIPFPTGSAAPSFFN